MKLSTRRWWLATAAAMAVAASAALATVVSAGANATPSAGGGLGQPAGLRTARQQASGLVLVRARRTAGPWSTHHRVGTSLVKDEQRSHPK